MHYPVRFVGGKWYGEGDTWLQLHLLWGGVAIHATHLSVPFILSLCFMGVVCLVKVLFFSSLPLSYVVCYTHDIVLLWQLQLQTVEYRSIWTAKGFTAHRLLVMPSLIPRLSLWIFNSTLLLHNRPKAIRGIRSREGLGRAQELGQVTPTNMWICHLVRSI